MFKLACITNGFRAIVFARQSLCTRICLLPVATLVSERIIEIACKLSLGQISACMVVGTKQVRGRPSYNNELSPSGNKSTATHLISEQAT